MIYSNSHNARQQRLGNLRRCRGFSLIEVFIILAIVSVLAILAGPSFADMMEKQRIKNAMTSIMSSIRHARSEAISRNSDVTMCASDDGRTCDSTLDWTAGWIIFHNPNLNLQPASANDIIHVVNDPQKFNGLVISNSTNNMQSLISYDSTGRGIRLPTGGFFSGTLQLRNPSLNDGWNIVVNRGGRIRLTEIGNP